MTEDTWEIFINPLNQNLESSANHQLIHYSTALKALSILQNGEFWLRNVRCMNDFSEVEHGVHMLAKTIFENTRLISLIEERFPYFGKRLNAQLTLGAANMWRRTFVGCLSIHERLDQVGKLSMWRAYGQKNGVGLVFEPRKMLEQPAESGLYSSKCLYWTQSDLDSAFSEICDRISDPGRPRAQTSEDELAKTIVDAFKAYAISLKHPAFEEEQEWRVIWEPEIATSVVEERVVCIEGVPQVVAVVPLKLHEAIGADFRLSNLLSSVIVGPTNYPTVIWDAINVALQPHMEEANRQIPIQETNIPLRS